MARIMVVEDEKQMQDILAEYMRRGGHSCVTAEDGVEALALLKQENADLLILDVMMPHLDGFTVCRLVRERSGIPIILLTAKAEEEDKLKGYEYGADDYMTKPFEIRELLMRIQAISRRSNHQDTSHPVVGNLSYDPATCEICNTQTKKSVQVSGKEMQLLEFFMNNCNQVLEKNQITTKIWGFDSNAEYNNVEVYVSFLRRKFHHLQVNVTIRAIRGVGYIMEVSDD